MCSFHGRAFLALRSIYAARAAMAGRTPEAAPAARSFAAAAPDLVLCPEIAQRLAVATRPDWSCVASPPAAKA